MTDGVIVGQCPARTALAGNPSDGYGGAVLSIPLPTLRAEVTVRPAERFVLAEAGAHGAHGDRTVAFETWEMLRRAASLVAPDQDHSLLLGAIAAADRVAGPIGPCAITTSTTIPRSVGLAGSSAIVIAALRALVRFAGRPPPPPDELASIALHVERDILQIPAGLQDRVVQAYERPVMMRFGTADLRRIGDFEAGGYQPLRPGADFGLFVAHRLGTAQPSQVTHRGLRDRFDAGETEVTAAMASLAAHAEAAATAFAHGSAADLGAAMDGSFDVRRSILDLVPEHIEMIETARRCGASANYTGSGGAIVVLCTDAASRTRTIAALTAIGGIITDI